MIDFEGFFTIAPDKYAHLYLHTVDKTLFIDAETEKRLGNDMISTMAKSMNESLE